MNQHRELDTKTIRHVEVPISNFKFDTNSGEFTCYGNVKNIIDYAGDRSVDGCFMATISRHKSMGTMPIMLWMHNPYDLPVGTWLDWEEDSKGLHMKGKLSQTTMGKDIEILARDRAVNKFSIGYRVVKGRWNDSLECYDLLEVDILEVSWVNFACNDESDLETIKSKMENGSLPTKRELQNILRKEGFSKRQAERIVDKYEPEQTNILEDVFGLFNDQELENFKSSL